MKFKIELEDFWLDEDNDLECELKSYITNQIVFEISKSIKEKTEEHLTKKVKEIINSKLDVLIDVHLENLINAGVLIRNGKEVSMTDHIKALFYNDRHWNSIDSKIKDYCKSFAKDMSLQYDAAFANKIVENMKTQGLLKSEVVQILLGGE